MDKVLEFWENQAKEHGQSDLATAPDHYYRELEIRSIMPKVVSRGLVLDIGCGNGYATQKYAERYSFTNFVGMDYSKAMIAEARKRDNRCPNTMFIVGDILDMSLIGSYHQIICTRVLINLKNWEEQKQAILNMKRALKPGGGIILVENTEGGLANLNRLRMGVGLSPIGVRWHNRYLPDEEFFSFIHQNFKIGHIENIGNLYYILSRVLYARLATDEGVEPRYDHPINRIAAELPSLGTYNSYSPNFLIVLGT